MHEQIEARDCTSVVHVIHTNRKHIVTRFPGSVQGASTWSQASSQAGNPCSASKPADAHRTIKTMAASLFRAFDEGKLRERGPVLAQQQGQASESLGFGLLL